MDLNISPGPEEGDSMYGETVEEVSDGAEFRAAGGGTMDQVRGGKHLESKRKYPDDEPMHISKQSKHSHNVQMNNNGFFDRNSLPPGWLDCHAFGDEISFIIPSKVPLGESFNDKIPSGKRYSPQQAISQQRLLGRDLGLVIDLTNTNRYYRESDWTKEGVTYVKIRCAGRDSVPDFESVEKFLHEASSYSNELSALMLSCTHRHKHIFMH